MSMNNLLPQLQPFKDKIPQFILKLYHILEKKEHEEYLTWFGENEVLIKNPKKFQEKVLPCYFRHKHLSSFIRQLNMYKFSKVSKILKQKNHLYFQNQNFQRGDIEKLLKIKRNVKKNRVTEQTILPDKADDASNSDNVSINQKLQESEKEKEELQKYKAFVKQSAAKIRDVVGKFASNPLFEQEFKPVIYLCDELLEFKHEFNPSFGLSSSNPSQQQLNLLNYSQRALPKIQADLIFPSQCSFYNFNNLHS